MTDDKFEQLINRAMSELPEEYIKNLDNVAITFADEPSEHQREVARVREHSLLLGLYEGIPLTSRGAGYTMVLPDKITIFKTPLLRISKNDEELFENIKRTVWHEIAHFYGLDHGRIHELESKE